MNCVGQKKLKIEHLYQFWQIQKLVSSTYLRTMCNEVSRKKSTHKSSNHLVLRHCNGLLLPKILEVLCVPRHPRLTHSDVVWSARHLICDQPASVRSWLKNQMRLEIDKNTNY